MNRLVFLCIVISGFYSIYSTDDLISTIEQVSIDIELENIPEINFFRAIDDILPVEIWQEIMDFLPGNDCFLNAYLARRFIVSKETEWNIKKAFMLYVKRHVRNKENYKRLYAFIRNFYKTTKLPLAHNFFYLDFEQFDLIEYAIENKNKKMLKTQVKNIAHFIKNFSDASNSDDLKKTFFLTYMFYIACNYHKELINKKIIALNNRVKNTVACGMLPMLLMFPWVLLLSRDVNYNIKDCLLPLYIRNILGCSLETAALGCICFVSLSITLSGCCLCNLKHTFNDMPHLRKLKKTIKLHQNRLKLLINIIRRNLSLSTLN